MPCEHPRKTVDAPWQNELKDIYGKDGDPDNQLQAQSERYKTSQVELVMKLWKSSTATD